MKRKNWKKIKNSGKYWLEFLLTALGMILVILLLNHLDPGGRKNRQDKPVAESDAEWCRPDLQVDLLTPNEYSRSGIALKSVKGIVVHYVGNAGTTAKENRDYFEGLKDTHITKASSHFIIGLDGEIVQCIPTKEISYASNNRNKDTISIECCHPDEEGRFNDKTYESLIHLTGYLCYRFGLDQEDIIRHYDVTGKMCPVYYVENEDAWKQFKEDVAAYLKNLKN